MDYFNENSTTVQIISGDITSLDVDAIVIVVYENLLAKQDTIFGKVKESIGELIDFNGKEKDVFVVYNVKGVKAPRVVLVGLGAENSSPETVRNGAGKAARLLRDKDVKKIAFESLNDKAHETAEGVILGLYKFDELKSSPKKLVSEITFVSKSDESSNDFRTGIVFARSQNVARRLAELPANIATPTFFCDQAIKLFADNSKVKVIPRDAQWAEEKKMGSFLSVTHGSDEPARFLEMHYHGTDPSKQPLILVGKGVTFDSGGISLKPAESMGNMRGDCGGAASVIGALLGISKLALPINVIGLTPLTENMPSGKATKPADVVVASNGKSIEIDNTDAEGRLILADALVYAESFAPHTVIDVATLTGAMTVALGAHFTGAFTPSDDLWNEIQRAGELTHERFWRLPLAPEYRSQINSDIADLKNTGGRLGGSITAAMFLKEFINVPRWIHLDIAGTALPGARDSSYIPNGMTGVPVRAFIHFAKNLVK